MCPPGVGDDESPECSETSGSDGADGDRESGEATGVDGASGPKLDGRTPGANGGTGKPGESTAGERTRDGPPASHVPAESTADGRNEWVTFAYDVTSSVLAVALVGVLLFAVSGVWPPMVAIESGSMTPHMQTGDLVFVMDEKRFPGEGAHKGVVTARAGGDVEYRKFDRPGDVIVYTPNGNTDRTPIIHRAMFWVEEGENWYEKADRQSVGRYSECGDTPDEAMPNCPAPHDGFVTKGDANGVYDQIRGLSGPVKPAWVVGTAEARVPLLGCLRLQAGGCLSLFAPPVVTASPADGTVPGAADATVSAAGGATVPGADDPTASTRPGEVGTSGSEVGVAVTRPAA